MQARTPADTLSRDASMAPAAVVAEGSPKLASRVSWGAVFAGAIIAIMVGVMLNALGAGIGALTIDATGHASPMGSTLGIGAAVWLLVANLIGLAVGGYAAARLSGTSDNTDGTLHGLAVWGTAFLVSAVLLGNLVAGLASTAASGASRVLSGAGSAISSVGQQAANRTDNNTLQNVTQGAVNRVQGALSGGGGNPSSMSSDQRKAEIGTLATRRVTDGQLSQQDRDRLNQLVAAEYGISQQDAQQRVQQAEQQAQQAAQQAEETARRAADAAATGTATTGFAIFGTMLLSALAAILGARRGTRDMLTVRNVRVI